VLAGKTAVNLVVCVKEVLHVHGLRAPTATNRPGGLPAPNRADECAVELAVRLREAHGGQVTLVSFAPPAAEAVLELYLGLGAEQLVRVWDEARAAGDHYAVALTLSRAVATLAADLILCGECAYGGEDTGLFGPALAEQLGWPFVGRVIAVELDGGGASVQRLIERGDRTAIRAPLPAVLAVSPEANQPRYPAYAKVRRARRQALDLSAIGLVPAGLPQPQTRITAWAPTRPRPKKLFAPPSTASAADRLRMVSGGGPARKSQGPLLEGSPDEAAAQILQFLQQEKLI
jgi:electron transfer flavoprotein beta subunit